ncbi:MAG TPA: Spy/CpxP family protein refolding chaperone [Bacteroidia bacterium]|nr:Spy/CpxP family protein refolding chaperone [Bacteroidia bacterium]
MKTIEMLSKNIRIATLVMLFAFVVPVLHAQDRRDKIENMHTAYLTEKVGLTPDQAKKFWPVYDQFKADEAELQKQRRQNAETVKNAGGIDNMNDADVQKLIENEIDVKTRELDLHKKYVVKFQEVISLKQVAKLFIAEEQFKLYLLNQLKNRRGGPRGSGQEPEFVPQ